MTNVSDVISFSEAARVKECSRKTLYKAANDGRLNDVEVGNRQMLIKDEAWEAFKPNLVGRRAQKLDEQDDDTDGTSQ